MTQAYRHNHYVPEWYQRRFLPAGQHELHYIDLEPVPFVLNGRTIQPPNQWIRGPRHCFAQDDLYTTKFGGVENTEIERFFFGGSDNKSPSAFDYWEGFDHAKINHEAYETFLNTMSLQRLRTPRGLEWLRRVLRLQGPNKTLIELQRLQNLFCATWSDAIWSIADASASPTKFIISDNPVTIYNRDCFPGSVSCRHPFDPDVRWAGTQTVYPLSAAKALILTNLTWARNPYQSATKMGPNERLLRSPLFNFLDIQIGRQLSEEEVLEINFIIKKRADRFIAASEKDWLFPEKRLRADHWRKLGDGYLLMPDPRHVFMGGTATVGYTGGGYDHWNEYGHRPGEEGFEDKNRDAVESAALTRFQAEWSAMFGPNYRGLTQHFAKHDRHFVSDEIHAHYLLGDEKYRSRPGERARRRALKRANPSP